MTVLYKPHVAFRGLSDEEDEGDSGTHENESEEELSEEDDGLDEEEEAGGEGGFVE